MTESSHGPRCPPRRPPDTTTGVPRRRARTAHAARLTQPPGSSDGKLERPTLPSPPAPSHNHRGPATENSNRPRCPPHTTTGVQRRNRGRAKESSNGPRCPPPPARLTQPPGSSDGKLERPTLPSPTPASHNHRGPPMKSSNGPRSPPRSPPNTTTGAQRRKAGTAHAARLTQAPGSSDGKLKRPTLPSLPRASRNQRGPATESSNGPRCPPHTTTGVQRRQARTSHAICLSHHHWVAPDILYISCCYTLFYVVTSKCCLGILS